MEAGTVSGCKHMLSQADCIKVSLQVKQPPSPREREQRLRKETVPIVPLVSPLVTNQHLPVCTLHWPHYAYMNDIPLISED